MGEPGEVDRHLLRQGPGRHPEDGRRIIATLGQPYFPTDWTDAITWEQETIDLVTDAGQLGGTSFDANTLFDRRFEKVVADAVPEKYRSEPVAS